MGGAGPRPRPRPPPLASPGGRVGGRDLGLDLFLQRVPAGGRTGGAGPRPRPRPPPPASPGGRVGGRDLGLGLDLLLRRVLAGGRTGGVGPRPRPPPPASPGGRAGGRGGTSASASSSGESRRAGGQAVRNLGLDLDLLLPDREDSVQHMEDGEAAQGPPPLKTKCSGFTKVLGDTSSAFFTQSFLNKTE
ncbi:hypothetical protein LEMLEM_LOCUS6114 [Lemmus lemmus]